MTSNNGFKQVFESAHKLASKGRFWQALFENLLANGNKAAINSR